MMNFFEFTAHMLEILDLLLGVWLASSPVGSA